VGAPCCGDMLRTLFPDEGEGLYTAAVSINFQHEEFSPHADQPVSASDSAFDMFIAVATTIMIIMLSSCSSSSSSSPSSIHHLYHYHHLLAFTPRAGVQVNGGYGDIIATYTADVKGTVRLYSAITGATYAFEVEPRSCWGMRDEIMSMYWAHQVQADEYPSRIRRVGRPPQPEPHDFKVCELENLNTPSIAIWVGLSSMVIVGMILLLSFLFLSNS
jgi:hypothetical protein